MLNSVKTNTDNIALLENKKANQTSLDATNATINSLNEVVSGKANNSTVTTLSNKVAAIEQGYIKDATVSNNKLSITKSDGSSFEFEGGGGSKVIWEVWE